MNKLMLLTLAVIIVPVAALILHAASPQLYVVNYGLLYIDNEPIQISLPINGTVTVPLRCTGSANITLMVDPRSPLGISSIYVIYSNGSIYPVLGLNTPKLVMFNVSCGQVFGLLVSVARYMAIPPVIYVYESQAMTGSFTGSGSLIINNTLPMGIMPLYSLITILAIGGTVSPESPFTFIVNETVLDVPMGNVVVRVQKYVYVSYIRNPMFKVSNSTVYYSVKTIYMIQPGPFPWTGYAFVSNDTDYYTVRIMGSYRQVTGQQYPIFIPGQRLVEINGSVSWSTTYATIKLSPWCTNYMLAGQIINGGFLTAVPSNNTVYLGNIPIANLAILGLAGDETQVQVQDIVLGSSIRVSTIDGYPVNATILLMGNGGYFMVRNNTCIMPGNYTVVVVSSLGTFRLGAAINSTQVTITLPIFHEVNVNVAINTSGARCGNLVVTDNYSGIMAPVVNGTAALNLTNIKYGSWVMVNAMLNGTVVGSSVSQVTSRLLTIQVKVNTINVKVTGIMGGVEARVSAGGLVYVVRGSSTICVPPGLKYIVAYTPLGPYTAPIVNGAVDIKVPLINMKYAQFFAVALMAILAIATLVKYLGGSHGGGDIEVIVGG